MYKIIKKYGDDGVILLFLKENPSYNSYIISSDKRDGSGRIISQQSTAAQYYFKFQNMHQHQMMPKFDGTVRDLPGSQFCNDTHYDWRLFYGTTVQNCSWHINKTTTFYSWINILSDFQL